MLHEQIKNNTNQIQAIIITENTGFKELNLKHLVFCFENHSSQLKLLWS